MCNMHTGNEREQETSPWHLLVAQCFPETLAMLIAKDKQPTKYLSEMDVSQSTHAETIMQLILAKGRVIGSDKCRDFIGA